jgi:NAD(P)-dependent dehydrogenase (short-subunit alcohol dehydrogenase family)
VQGKLQGNRVGLFSDKVCIVVGGGRGIGRATALALAREGARVVIDDLGCAADGTGQDPDVAQQVLAEIRALGGEGLALSHDARESDAARRTVAAAKAAFGEIHGGFYCAGVVRDRPLLRMDDTDLDALLDVQARGAFRFTRDLARVLVEQRKGGSIVLSGSAAAFLGSQAQAGAAMAAGAIASFTRTAATELRRHNVRVNCVMPTARTRLTEHLPLFQSIRADSLTPEHAAQVVCHLLSDAAADVHGELLGVAGGRTYALRVSETSGAFREGAPASLAEIAGSWREVTRG